MTLRTLIAPIAIVALALLAGCGGENAAAGAANASTIAPASTQLFATVDADTGSDQWEQLQDLLDRFPGRDRLVDELRTALADEGLSKEELEDAFGPTVDFAAMDLSDEGGVGVGLTQTDDRAALEALLAKSDEELVVEELEDGWFAFSDDRASIAAFETAAAKGTLADDAQFSDAMGELADEALVKLYVDGRGLGDELEAFGSSVGQAGLVALSAAVVAADDGASVQFWAKTDGSVEPPDVGELVGDVPSDAIAFVDFGLGQTEAQLREGLQGALGAEEALDAFEQQLGVSLEDVTALLRDEVLVYVRPGLLIPEVTLVATTDDTAEGRETVDALLEAAAGLTGGQTRTTRIGDLEATVAVLGPVSLYATAYDDRVVVSTSQGAIEDLRDDGDKLVDDDGYQDVLEAAGVGDDQDVFVYVDMDEAYALAERVAQLADEPLPPDVRENLEPLRAVVVAGELGDDESRGSFFLALD